MYDYILYWGSWVRIIQWSSFIILWRGSPSHIHWKTKALLVEFPLIHPKIVRSIVKFPSGQVAIWCIPVSPCIPLKFWGHPFPPRLLPQSLQWVNRQGISFFRSVGDDGQLQSTSWVSMELQKNTVTLWSTAFILNILNMAIEIAILSTEHGDVPILSIYFSVHFYKFLPEKIWENSDFSGFVHEFLSFSKWLQVSLSFSKATST